MKFVHQNLAKLDNVDEETSEEDRLSVIEDAIKRFCEIHQMILVGTDEEVEDV